MPSEVMDIEYAVGGLPPSRTKSDGRQRASKWRKLRDLIDSIINGEIAEFGEWVSVKLPSRYDAGSGSSAAYNQAAIQGFQCNTSVSGSTDSQVYLWIRITPRV